MVHLLPGYNWRPTYRALKPGQKILPDSPILVDGDGKPVKGGKINVSLTAGPPHAWFEGLEHADKAHQQVGGTTGPKGTITMPAIQAGTQQWPFMLLAACEDPHGGVTASFNILTRRLRLGEDWSSGFRTVRRKDTVTVDSPILTDLSDQPVEGEEIRLDISPALAAFEGSGHAFTHVTGSKGRVDVPRIVIGSARGSFDLRASTPRNYVDMPWLRFVVQ